MEAWKTIDGFQNYQVSSLGRVRSIPRVITRRDGQRQGISGGVLSPVVKDNHGVSYGEVTLSDIESGKCHVIRKVHQLVLEAFSGERPDGAVARHLNGDSLDNRVENLAWGTVIQNVKDRDRHGKTWRPAGEQNPRSKLNPEAVKVVRHFYHDGRAVYGMRNRLARAYGVSESLISQIGRGLVWTEAA